MFCLANQNPSLFSLIADKQKDQAATYIHLYIDINYMCSLSQGKSTLPTVSHLLCCTLRYLRCRLGNCSGIV